MSILGLPDSARNDVVLSGRVHNRRFEGKVIRFRGRPLIEDCEFTDCIILVGPATLKNVRLLNCRYPIHLQAGLRNFACVSQWPDGDLQ